MSRILSEIRAEASTQLYAYRRGRATAWRQAIDAARGVLRTETPEIERFMSRLYGLDVPLNRVRSQQARMMQLGESLGISVSTAYKWREQILDVVVVCALAREVHINALHDIYES